MDIDEALERTQWDVSWVPPGTRVVDRPELLFLSSSEPDEYLNSVLRIRPTDDSAESLVAEVSAAHAKTSSRVPITNAARSDALERALSRHGYAPMVQHFAYALACADHRPTNTGITVRPIETVDDLRAAVAITGRAFGRVGQLSEERLAIDLAACTRPGTRIHRYVAWDGDVPVATAGLNLFPQLDLGFFWGGGTVPEARGRGAYSALVDARIAAARALGVSRVAVYAREQTSAPIVERRGFRRHGPMTFWSRAKP